MAAPRHALRMFQNSRPLWHIPSARLPSRVQRPVIRLQTQVPSRIQTREYQRFSYQRFQATSGLLRRWSQHPYFYYHIAIGGGVIGGFYTYNLEEVPVSHRRRFNIISADTEKQSGQQLYQQVMQQYAHQILPATDPKHRMAQDVLNRLIPHSGLSSEDNEWELHVIQDEQKNAFVIPGGKVFVFSGILDVCNGKDGLAAVLGHEIAHNVAHHAAEKMSQSSVLMLVGIAVSYALGLGDIGLTQLLVDVGFLRPNGRKQESEADYIGLMMMSEACFDPTQAVGLWARMEKAEEGNAPPQFLSTHPSSHNRMEAIRGWLPQAEAKQNEAGCGMVSGFTDDFRYAFSRMT